MKGFVHISQWPLWMPHGDHDLLLPRTSVIFPVLCYKRCERRSRGEVGRVGGCVLGPLGILTGHLVR